MRGDMLLLCCYSSLAILMLLTPAHGADSTNSNKDRVLLKEVTALTLEQGKMTTGRRSSPVQQLKCVGGSAGCSSAIQPRVVECINNGIKNHDVQWKCDVMLDSKYQFGRIQVSCEDYEYPDDPYILRGSCGLQYEFDFNEEPLTDQKQTSWLTWAIVLVVSSIIVYLIWKTCNSKRKEKTDDINAGTWDRWLQILKYWNRGKFGGTTRNRHDKFTAKKRKGKFGGTTKNRGDTNTATKAFGGTTRNRGNTNTATNTFGDTTRNRGNTETATKALGGSSFDPNSMQTLNLACDPNSMQAFDPACDPNMQMQSYLADTFRR